jgi:hypothetical protein
VDAGVDAAASLVRRAVADTELADASAERVVALMRAG